jgi:DNA-binding FadR family transcriptional regulator
LIGCPHGPDTGFGVVAEGVALTNVGAELPAYRQVAEALEGRIREGEFGVGAKLPSLTKLAETYGVNREVARNAISHLQARGIAATVKGSGSYVVSTDDVDGPGLTSEVAALRRGFDSLEERMAKLEGRLGEIGD